MNNKKELSDKTDPIPATGAMVLAGLGAYIKQHLEKQGLIVRDKEGYWWKTEDYNEHVRESIKSEKGFIEKYLPTFYSVYKALKKHI